MDAVETIDAAGTSGKLKELLAEGLRELDDLKMTLQSGENEVDDSDLGQLADSEIEMEDWMEVELYDCEPAYHVAQKLLAKLFGSNVETEMPIKTHGDRVKSGERGVSLLFLKAFTDFVQGRSEQGGDKPNANLMENICRSESKSSVSALTDSTGLSLVESCIHVALQAGIPEEDYSPLFGRATTFFSYAWTGTSLDDIFESLKVVALNELPLGHTKTYFWIDMFCASQNLLAGKYKPLKEDTNNIFADAIDTVDSVILYFSPLVRKWAAPNHPYLCTVQGEPPKDWQRKGPCAITRAWCLFEVAESLRRGHKLHLALSPSDKDSNSETGLWHLLTKSFDEILAIFSDTDAQKAQLSKIDDRDFICTEINKLEKGFDDVNRTVKNGLWDWLEATTKTMVSDLDELDMSARGGSGELLKDLQLASIKNAYARVLQERLRCDEAEDYFKQALELYDRNNKTGLAAMLDNLRCLVSTQAASLRYLRRQIAHGAHAATMNNLAVLLEGQNKTVQAEPFYRKSLMILRRISDKNDRSSELLVATALSNLAGCVETLGKHVEAESLHRQGLALRRKNNDQPAIAISLNNIGCSLREQGKHGQAETHLQEAVEILREVYTGSSNNERIEMVAPLCNLAYVLNEQGKRVQAKSLYQEALTIAKRVYDQDHPHVHSITASLLEL